jgi:elongation factor P
MSRVLVLNGPNLGRLGSREPDVYGAQDLSALRVLLDEKAADGTEIDLRQTDDEAEMIRWMHEAVDSATPVIVNPGAFTHYSYALADAAKLVTAAGIPLVEVHISNPHARETFRHSSVISAVATGTIAGFGFDSYVLALRAIQGAWRAGGGRGLSSTLVATTNDIKNGSVLNLDGQLWNVIEFQHVKPGKGGAFVRTKLKSVLSGKVVDRTFNAGTKIDFATVDRRDFQYLYKDGDGFVFMDTADYDQVTVPSAVVGDAANYMLENQNVQVAMHEGEALYVELPTSVVLEVTYTEPGLQGDRSSAGTKPATLETGHEIQVPLFLEQGTRVKVDTRDGSYLGRVTD